MKSIFRRHSLITHTISKEIYSAHEEKYKGRFGEHIPTYAEVFDWINDATGIAIFINIVGHTEWDNSRPRADRDAPPIPSKTSLPYYRSFAFHYGELTSCPDDFVDDWEGCADNAINTFLSIIYETDLWYDEFTEEYDGSCNTYKSIDEYIKAQKTRSL